MKKFMRRSVALMMMLTMILAATSTTFAAAKTKTVKKHAFSTSTSVINKSATKVKKGTNKLYIKRGQGYIKFVAPKTKTYSFTFSNCKSKKDSSNGFVEVQMPDKYSPKYSFMTEVSTKGGKNNTLWLSVNGHKFTGDIADRPIATRTGKIKLKKGAVIYMFMSFLDTPTNVKLVIK